MPQLHQFANQRQYQRFKAKNRAFAMLADWTIKFDIVDISKNGLSFLYLGKAQWFDKLSELDIAYEGGQFLKNIPIISISDSTYTNCLIPMRRHSVMFHKLESLQNPFNSPGCSTSSCSATKGVHSRTHYCHRR
jgi:hypothetical protein